jgi:tellurite resistance protein
MLLGIALWVIIVLAAVAVIHVAVDRALEAHEEKKYIEALERSERLDKERRDRVEAFYNEYQESADCERKRLEEFDEEIKDPSYTTIKVDNDGDFLAFDIDNSIEEIAQ